MDGTTLPVVVDNYSITGTWQSIFGDTYDNLVTDANNPLWQFTIPSDYIYKDNIRPEMSLRIIAWFPPLNNYVNLVAPFFNGTEPLIQSVTSNGDGTKTVTLSNPITNVAPGGWDNNNAVVVFEEERVLNFSKDNIITGVNVIDNLLFWTDNSTEPKKVNIDRSKEGTAVNTSAALVNFQLGLDPDGNAITSNIPISSIFDTHTKVFGQNPNNIGIEDYIDVGGIGPSALVPSQGGWTTNSFLKERHITTIRRAPRVAPVLEMDDDDRTGLNSFNINWIPYTNPGCYYEFIEVGISVIIDGGWNGNFLDSELYSGDIIVITQTNVNTDILDPVVIKVKFEEYVYLAGEDTTGDGNCDTDCCEYTASTQNQPYIRAKVLSITGPLSVETSQWDVSLEKRKPLFELGFGRFGYRYKYEDGEYSSFSPWSELAFMPGVFDYKPKKGYNLGMTNIIRKLVIKGFIPTNRPLDMVAVDILYKKTDSPNVYVVKTIKRGVDDEWELFDLPQSYNVEEKY